MSGDYYGYSINHGLVLRNGELFQSKLTKGVDVCVLYRDGTMKTYPADSFEVEAITENAWQAWSFGPSLLDEYGRAKSGFESAISTRNPRAILGYYEPGHYCLVVVDGRKRNYSWGLTMDESARLMEALGCKVAYNLDGGQSAELIWNDDTYGIPYDGGRDISDIIYIEKIEKVG